MSMLKYFRLAFTEFKIDLAGAMLDKSTFFMDFLCTFISEFIMPVVTTVIYSQTSGIPGWTLAEFILLQGTFMLSFGIAGFGVFSSVYSLGGSIDHGEFDRFLLRPMKLVPYFLTNLNPWYISNITAGAVIATIGLISVNWAFNLTNLLMYIALLLSSIMVWFFIATILTAIQFKYPGGHPLLYLFWEVKRLGNYPLTIYGNALRFILTFVLPFGIAGFYPAEAILGRMTDFNQFLILIAACFAFGIAGYFILDKSVKNYESAGG